MKVSEKEALYAHMNMYVQFVHTVKPALAVTRLSRGPALAVGFSQSHYFLHFMKQIYPPKPWQNPL